MALSLVSVDFEIFGRVQGVCFRMYTEDESRKLRLVGWVKNAPTGSVVGVVQGPADKVEAMKHWLSKVGSPSSRIHKAEFHNERKIAQTEFKSFGTR
uniref:acylphosphatase-2 n=1 Tax=Myxine glutinosa TaxID=7769 RepID=UPI00358FCFFC